MVPEGYIDHCTSKLVHHITYNRHIRPKQWGRSRKICGIYPTTYAILTFFEFFLGTQWGMGTAHTSTKGIDRALSNRGGAGTLVGEILVFDKTPFWKKSGLL